MADVGTAQLSLPWRDVLRQLSDGEDGRLRMGELAESVLLTRSGVTQLLDHMIRLCGKHVRATVSAIAP